MGFRSSDWADSPLSTPLLPWLCKMEHLGNIAVAEGIFQDNLVHGFIHASFKKICPILLFIIITCAPLACYKTIMLDADFELFVFFFLYTNFQKRDCFFFPLDTTFYGALCPFFHHTHSTLLTPCFHLQQYIPPRTL